MMQGLAACRQLIVAAGPLQTGQWPFACRNSSPKHASRSVDFFGGQERRICFGYFRGSCYAALGK